MVPHRKQETEVLPLLSAYLSEPLHGGTELSWSLGISTQVTLHHKTASGWYTHCVADPEALTSATATALEEFDATLHPNSLQMVTPVASPTILQSRGSEHPHHTWQDAWAQGAEANFSPKPQSCGMAELGVRSRYFSSAAPVSAP